MDDEAGWLLWSEAFRSLAGCAKTDWLFRRASHTDGCDRWSVQSLRRNPAERGLPTDVRSETVCYPRRGPKAAQHERGEDGFA